MACEIAVMTATFRQTIINGNPVCLCTKDCLTGQRGNIDSSLLLLMHLDKMLGRRQICYYLIRLLLNHGMYIIYTHKFTYLLQ